MRNKIFSLNRIMWLTLVTACCGIIGGIFFFQKEVSAFELRKDPETGKAYNFDDLDVIITDVDVIQGPGQYRTSYCVGDSAHPKCAVDTVLACDLWTHNLGGYMGPILPSGYHEICHSQSSGHPDYFEPSLYRLPMFDPMKLRFYYRYVIFKTKDLMKLPYFQLSQSVIERLAKEGLTVKNSQPKDNDLAFMLYAYICNPTKEYYVDPENIREGYQPNSPLTDCGSLGKRTGPNAFRIIFAEQEGPFHWKTRGHVFGFGSQLSQALYAEEAAEALYHYYLEKIEGEGYFDDLPEVKQSYPAYE